MPQQEPFHECRLTVPAVRIAAPRRTNETEDKTRTNSVDYEWLRQENRGQEDDGHLFSCHQSSCRYHPRFCHAADWECRDLSSPSGRTTEDTEYTDSERLSGPSRFVEFSTQPVLDRISIDWCDLASLGLIDRPLDVGEKRVMSRLQLVVHPECLDQQVLLALVLACGEFLSDELFDLWWKRRQHGSGLRNYCRILARRRFDRQSGAKPRVAGLSATTKTGWPMGRRIGAAHSNLDRSPFNERARATTSQRSHRARGRRSVIASVCSGHTTRCRRFFQDRSVPALELDDRLSLQVGTTFAGCKTFLAVANLFADNRVEKKSRSSSHSLKVEEPLLDPSGHRYYPTGHSGLSGIRPVARNNHQQRSSKKWRRPSKTSPSANYTSQNLAARDSTPASGRLLPSLDPRLSSLDHFPPLDSGISTTDFFRPSTLDRFPTVTLQHSPLPF